jgi:thiosulfate dehydrogenase [quinone] large subunit
VHSKNDFESDRAIGYCLLRATLGINIFLHGVSRMLAGTGNFAANLVGMFHATPLPAVVVRHFGYALPWMEAMVGLLVLLGLWTRYALASGALLIFVLTFGTALRQDWETAGLQLTYALVFGALLVFRHWNTLSFDVLLHKSGTRQ